MFVRGRVWVDDWVEVGVVSAEKEATTGVRSRVLPPIVEGRDKRTRRGHALEDDPCADAAGWRSAIASWLGRVGAGPTRSLRSTPLK